ncbi:MAG TPA: hypothetical protein EYG86_06405 [Crocinitomicaceae bacterium]|nr:hypothetical protein [Crocinitomicaceae bacterium]
MKLISTTFYLAICLSIFSFSANKKPSKKRALKTLNSFCSYIPSGNAVVESDTFSVQSFYMSKGEITNLQYQEFLFDLKKKGMLNKLAIANIDSTGWNSPLAINSKYVEFYHRHPAYNNYPVVNVSKKGAELYCEWLSEKYDTLSNGELKITFRLPQHAEWIRAARGDHHEQRYSWSGLYLRNEKGIFLANFAKIGVESIHYNQEDKKYEVMNISIDGFAGSPLKTVDVTAPAESYWPNEFGIYNLNGNVAEMIADKNTVVGGGWKSPGFDIRNDAQQEYQGPSTNVGFRIVASYVE